MWGSAPRPRALDKQLGPAASNADQAALSQRTISNSVGFFP